MRWYVGTSGWGYNPWKGTFYPQNLPNREWISYYAKHFDSVEINTTFYHLPRPQQIVNWEEMVPKRFTFAIKGSRYITHLKRLKEPGQGVKKMMRVLRSRKKKGPIIFQLPPRFPKDIERLEKFIKILPKHQRYAIEFRDPDWHQDDVLGLLKRHNVAFCLFEKEKLFSPRLVTAPFVYVRLHGRKEDYKGNYSRSELRDWHTWLKAQMRDVYIYFDNTTEKIYALENAMTFKKMTEA